MKGGNCFYLLLLVANGLVSAFSQILLKKASLRKYRSVIGQYVNVFVVCGYILFLGVICINIYLLRYIPMSIMGPVAEVLPIIFSITAGRFVFGERFTVQKMVGVLLILSGVIVIL